MSSTSGFPLKKPRSVWHKPIKINFSAFFKALSNAGIDALTGQWPGLGKDAVEVLAAIGLDEDNPEELAWALIYTAMTSAIGNLLSETHLSSQERANRLQIFSEHLDHSLAHHTLDSPEEFFQQPRNLDVLKEIQMLLHQWLKATGFEEAHASAFSRRLPTYFVCELHREWQQRNEKYERICVHVETPFTVAQEQQRQWGLYHAWLQKQVEAPMMLEHFGLSDVYVPLRAYFKRIRRDRQTEKVVVNLERSLNDWMSAADPKDAMRIVSGGPGSGKSSFAKIFAAKLAREHLYQVLFVPLHLLDFDQTLDFSAAINEFIRYDQYLNHTPLDPDNEHLKLLIICDGLDELSFRGELAQTMIQAFLKEVHRTLKQFNRRKARVQIIITGREITVQASFKGSNRILTVLPYIFTGHPIQQSAINRKATDLHTTDLYVDEHQLLKQDQRVAWWKRYGMVTNTHYSVMPECLLYPDLIDLTAQPLLNYLVATSYVSGKLSLTQNANLDDTNLNTVYAHLLEEVCTRRYADSGKHLAIHEMSEPDFIHILELIALAAWHGHQHSATISQVEALCASQQAKQLLETFQEGAAVGITRLLAAFYFRQGEMKDSEHTFEFTHKSFGEYLAARRIVTTMDDIQTQRSQQEHCVNAGWTTQDALLQWAHICGPAEMDSYLLAFVRNEIALKPIEQVHKLQLTFAELIGAMLQHGMPMEKLGACHNYHLQTRWARNSEEALLAVLNACALVTEKISVIHWPHVDSFGTWLDRLQSKNRSAKTPYSDSEHPLAFSSLSFLDLSNTDLKFQDLHDANLERSNLNGANLYRANLDSANLRKASLMRTDLSKASLDSACLDGASLDEATLDNASLNAASLVQASLIEADLHCASLKNASLNNASLNGTTFQSADLRYAILNGAQLEHANFTDARLECSTLYKTHLNEANLAGAYLDDANCVETQFQNARLEGTSCERTSMACANLSAAVLDGASFYEAKLDGANLDGASLAVTNLQNACLACSSLRQTTVDSANVAAANFTGIVWDSGTQFLSLRGVERAVGIPPLLRQQALSQPSQLNYPLSATED
ncbi:MAG: pentapeptide repeat-containing protein [Cyanobacteria bacterium P01_D01_bin.105]